MNNTFTESELNTIGFAVARALSEFDLNTTDIDEQSIISELSQINTKLNLTVG